MQCDVVKLESKLALEFSPTMSDNSIHRVRNEPERQLGSLRGVIGNITSNGGTPSVDSIVTELSNMPATVQRASVLLALQQTHGNRYVQQVVAGIQAKLKVGQPGSVYELEADRMADAVMRMPRLQTPDSTEVGTYTKRNTPILMRKTEGETAKGKQHEAKGEKVSEGLKRKIAAIALAESYPGQERDIRWIYYNLWRLQSDKGLKRSVAYKNKGMWYKVWMIALGDTTFANDKGTSGDPKKYKNLSEYVKKHTWFRKVAQKRANKTKKLVDDVFENPDKNPFKGWLGQGNLSDFNNDYGKWKKARQYFYLQKQGKVKEILVSELPADQVKDHSFIFDEKKIDAYFKKNPLPDVVEKYEPKK